MTLDDFDEFCEVVVGFAELKGKQLSSPALKLYFRALESWDLREFKQAAEHLLRTCEFMPTPKDFEDLRKAGEPTAAEAWTLAMQGDYPAGGVIDRLVTSLGGHRALMMANIERDLPHMQRRFIQAYDELSERESVREQLPQIAGPTFGHRQLRIAKAGGGFQKLGLAIRTEDAP